MKIKILLFTGILLFVCQLSAQEKQHRLSKDDVIARKWEFMLQKTNISAADALKVEPLFKEAELEIWSLIEKNRAVFKNRHKTDPNLKVDYEAFNDAMVNFDVENALIQKNYYLKLKKVIAPEVINKLLSAEKSYKRELIKNAPERKKGMDPPQR
jgi:hypothetical protein